MATVTVPTTLLDTTVRPHTTPTPGTEVTVPALFPSTCTLPVAWRIWLMEDTPVTSAALFTWHPILLICMTGTEVMDMVAILTHAKRPV